MEYRMKLGTYTLRSPIVKYSNIPLEEELYDAIRSSIIDDLINERNADHDYDITLLELLRNKNA